jgi:hypothetical protein
MFLENSDESSKSSDKLLKNIDKSIESSKGKSSKSSNWLPESSDKS